MRTKHKLTNRLQTDRYFPNDRQTKTRQTNRALRVIGFSKKAISSLVTMTFMVSTLTSGIASKTMASEGRTVLVRHPSVDPLRGEAMAEAFSWTPLSQELEARRPGSANENRLREALSRAQSAWLDGSLESARDRFLVITQMSLSADWQMPQRKVIHYAFLRAAQTESTTLKRDALLERAASLYPDLVPDRDLFPPPILEAYQGALNRARRASIEVNFDSLFKNDSVVLVNGRRINKNTDDAIRIAPGEHRISAFSDSHFPHSEVLDANRLSTFNMNRSSIAIGHCDAPELIALPDLGTAKLAVMYSADCVRTKIGSEWLPSEPISSSSHLANSDLAKLSSKNTKPVGLPVGFLGNPLVSVPSPAVRSDQGRNWLIAAGIFVAGAIALSVKRSQDEKSAIPVHREGLD
jgi:hypothetical protein